MLIEPVKDFRLVSCMFWYVDMYQWLMSRHMNVSLRPDAEERGRPTGQNASKTTIGWSIFFYMWHISITNFFPQFFSSRTPSYPYFFSGSVTPTAYFASNIKVTFL